MTILNKLKSVFNTFFKLKKQNNKCILNKNNHLLHFPDEIIKQYIQTQMMITLNQQQPESFTNQQIIDYFLI